tara:strand:- start:11648 stop:11827 length:180 start_codon:yes stop_codon:yes gene_type:complete
MKYSAFKSAVLGQTQKFFDQMDEVIANPTLSDSQKVEEFIRIGNEYDMDQERISQLEVA